MDNQIQHSSSVHVCQKCRWPYPTQHPNSKRRRAHRKVCGTIHGYELAVIDPEGSAHSNVSDEDRNNPSVEEARELLPKKSEEEVFSDAATDFAVFGAEKAREHPDKGSNAIPVAADRIEVQHSDTPQSMNNTLINAPEFPGHSSSSTNDASLEAVDSDSLDVKILPTEVSCELKNLHEDNTVRLKMSETNIPAKVESAVTNTCDVSDDQIEKKGEVEANVHLITVSDAIREVDDPTILLEDFKDHYALKSNQSAPSEDHREEVNKEGSDELGVTSKVVVAPMDKVASDSCSKSGDLFESTHLIGEDDREKTVSSGISGDYDGKGATEFFHTKKNGSESELTINSSEKLDMDLNGEEESRCYEMDGIKEVNTEEFGGDAFLMRESTEKFSGIKIIQETDLDDVGIHEKKDINGDARDAKTQADTSEIHTSESCLENVDVTPEHANKLTETETPHVNSTANLQEGDSSDITDACVEPRSQITAEDVSVKTTVSVAQIGEEKEIGNDEVMRLSTSVDNQSSSAKESDVASGLGSKSFPGESERKQLGGSVLDISTDSLSQTDSLENNWGSVSVLSIQSDAQGLIEAEVRPERNELKQTKSSIEDQHPEKPELIEPPSFMTLVEPKNPNASEIQTSQANTSALQAGWFPSINHVANESEGRKKNEEMIAKVTNWSAGKQHTPLKSLLGEASLEARGKSPKQKGGVTVNSILAPESPSGQREVVGEWESPARYPTEIKREKRKAKSRPYWAQFMCCSSVH